jgi:hypothetical protein
MSVLSVHKFCRAVLHDPLFRELALSNPDEAVLQFEFSDDERRALLEGDVARLYELGASPFLLLIFSRFEIFGLSLDIYNTRMRKLSQES